MSTSEIYFLRAEGKLRGWNMGTGTAQSLYEEGVAASFEQHGVSGVATYLASTNLPKNYVDPVAAGNNGTAVNLVPVKYDASATKKVQLQQIITQKWIANFPEGQEAWSEYRRTGFPKLFPVLVNASAGTIDSALGIRRVNFVDSEKAGNPQGVASALPLLGGPDNGGTRLWWDKDVEIIQN